MTNSFKKARVFAPATVSNLNCGFDVLGFALNEPGDMVEMELNDSGDIILREITGDDGKLPRETELNTATAVIKLFREQTKIPFGVDLTLHKQMPLNSGLGSSAASSVAALAGINALNNYPLDKTRLLQLAMEGERLACGNAHADNVAPALYGGMVLIRSYDPLDIIELPVPEAIWVAIIHPEVSIPTREARQILPHHIPLKDAVVQWGNLAGFVAGLYNNDFDLISRSMQDVLIEPYRKSRIPYFDEMRQMANEAGVISFGISGSGPTVFALCNSNRQATHVAQILGDFLSSSNLANQTYVSPINRQGPVIQLY